MRRAPLRVSATEEGRVSVAPLVPPELATEVDSALAEAASPQIAATVRDLNRLIAAHRSIGNTILARLREDGPLPGDPDPVADAAAARGDSDAA
jgi:hypothetical protein